MLYVFWDTLNELVKALRSGRQGPNLPSSSSRKQSRRILDEQSMCEQASDQMDEHQLIP